MNKDVGYQMREKIRKGQEERPFGVWDRENLKWLIKESGEKLSKIAEVTGINENSLKMYQSGYSTPGLDATLKLADYFRVPVDFLVGRCTERESGEIFDHFSEYFLDLKAANYDVYLMNKYAGDDTIRTDYVSTWPFNLIEQIYMREGKNECIEFNMSGLEEAISTLNDREIGAIYLRYKEDKTLRDAGEEIGVGPERFRQILAKACRKLRHPSRMRLIQYGTLGEEKRKELNAREAALKAKEEELNRLEAALQEREEKLGEKIENAEVRIEPVEPDMFLPIEELDFSVRTFNCLKRANCRTFKDVAELTERGDLLKVRNLGKRSAEEVLFKLKTRCGLDYSENYRWYAA